MAREAAHETGLPPKVEIVRPFHSEAICGVVTVTGYALLVTATRIGEASLLAPVRYTRLVFALILAVIVFGERLDPLTVAGAAIIVGSGCYTVWREASLARRRGPAAEPAAGLPLQPHPTRSTPSASEPTAA